MFIVCRQTLISRLVAEDDGLWATVETTMNALLTPALSVITEIFACYAPVPFGLNIDEFSAYAAMQYQKRYERLLAARGSRSAAEALTHAAIDADDI